MNWLTENWMDVVNVVAYVIAAASIVTKFTANKLDDKIVGKILNFLALIPKK